MVKKEIANLSFDEMAEGSTFSFDETITAKMVDAFAELSGDHSSLHINEDFAKSRGFDGRVVHGVLLAGLLSRLVGMRFPGENAILSTMNIQFVSPAYPMDKVSIIAKVEQVSAATKTIVLKSVIRNVATEKIILRCKILVGFTD